MKEIQIDLSDGPDPLPKAGDTVNYVQAVNKIIPAKVISVIEKTEGRAITVINPDPKAKGPVRVTHRPKAALAGNTWHWPGKAAAMLLLLACQAVAFVAHAGLPTYHTLSAIGNAAAPSSVIFPADPNSQIRVISVNFTTDTNNSQMTFISGTTAYSVISTNPATSSITNIINSTNGLSGGSELVLQHGSGDYTNAVVSWGNVFTNLNGLPITNAAWVVTGTGGFGVYPTVGDGLYLMSNSTSLYIPTAQTNAINGDDVYSGNYGRPVQVTLSPANFTNRLSAVSAHYDSASQP